MAHVTSKMSSYLSAAVQLYIVRAFSLVANGIPTSILTKLKSVTESEKYI